MIETYRQYKGKGFEIIAVAMPYDPPNYVIKFVQDRPGHDQRYAIDASKLEGELGWRAQENFDTGIEKTVRWYLENTDWWQPLRDKVYSGQRLGLLENQAAG